MQSSEQVLLEHLGQVYLETLVEQTEHGTARLDDDDDADDDEGLASVLTEATTIAPISPVLRRVVKEDCTTDQWRAKSPVHYS